jgi:hypothetical protein
MTTTTASGFRCDAETVGDIVHRCDRPGLRYRDGRWLCAWCPKGCAVFRA